jgi:hypothetical protein
MVVEERFDKDVIQEYQRVSEERIECLVYFTPKE